MAAGEYLKTAAASLYRAADHLKQQAKEMQANLTRFESDKKSQIDKQALEIRVIEAARQNTDDRGKQSRLSMKISRLQQEIMAAEQEIKQAEANVQNATTQKLNQSAEIEIQAKQLESQAGAVD